MQRLVQPICLHCATWHFFESIKDIPVKGIFLPIQEMMNSRNQIVGHSAANGFRYAEPKTNKSFLSTVVCEIFSSNSD
jgi:hypothetical protein